MKRVMNNLLILIFFLSPIVNGLEMDNYQGEKAARSSHVIFHEHQQQVDQIICIDNCCQNCQCDGLLVAVILSNQDINNGIQIHYFEHKFDFIVFVPFQEYHPLFRPPIV